MRNWAGLCRAVDACDRGGHAAQGLGSYSYHRPITIAHANVPNTDQTNFPVLISGTYSYLATTANGGLVQNASGYDIVFSSDAAGANRLSFEREKYVPTTGEVDFWVKIPTLSHTADTTIYMWYGNASVTTDPATPTQVWDSSFKGVWHLSNGTTLSAGDSTGANNGTISGATATTGQIDGAAAFDGWDTYPTGQYISLPNASAFANPQLTVSGWMKFSLLTFNPGNNPFANVFLYGGGNANGNYGLSVYSQNSYYYGNMNYTVGSATVSGSRVNAAGSAGGWYYVVETFDGATVKGYLNGVLDGSTSTVTYSPSTQTPTISNGNGNYSGSWTGSIDEVRVSSAARSADWIATEYNNQNSPSTFYSVGADSGPNTVSTPTFSVAPGVYASAQTVAIGTTTSGATIRYTTNGTAPSETAGTLYSGPLNIGSTTTLNAIAYESGWTDSNVATATYTIGIGTPTLSSPANLAVGQPTTPTLTWQAAPGATSYILYLDTVNPPLQHYGVTGASFTASVPLQGGELYYWYVVGNNGSLTGPASSTWSFWMTGAASNVSVVPEPDPTATQGVNQKFAFTFRSPNGWQDIAWTEMEFNYYNIGSGACFLGFWPGSSQVALMPDDASQGWMWFGNLGQSQATAANSQCSVDLSNSSMSLNANDPTVVTLHLSLHFLAGLPGPQEIWMQAGDSEGDAPVWQQMGSWTTSTVINQGPSTVSEAPPSGGWSGMGGMFTYKVSSPNG